MGHAEQSLDEMLSSEEKNLLVDLVQSYQEGRISRRGLLAMLGGAGVGAGAVLAGTDRAAGDPSTSDSYGNVGLPNDRVDVFADGIDLETTLEGNGTVKTDVDNQSVSTDEHTINDLSVLLEKTADQSISADTDTTVDWDSQDVDSNIYSYNTSADTIDILNAGDYHISVYYRISGISSGDLLYVRLYLNGSLQRIFTHEANSASDERFGLSYTEKDLAANDTLRFDVRSSADTTLKGDTQSTFASLTRSG